MKRRTFAGLTATIIAGYHSSKFIESKLEYDHPPLVHKSDNHPTEIIPTDAGVEIRELEEDKYDTLILALNKYGNPQNIVMKYELKARNGVHQIEVPDFEHEVVAYTLYSNSNTYLGESNPLSLEDGKFEENVEKIPKTHESKHPLERVPRRGYFEITILPNDISFPISYQRYEMADRILTYGRSHRKAKNSYILEQIGKRILTQSDANSQVEKIRVLKDFAQKMEWQSDFQSVGKLEYIRDPAKTLVNMFGDCKDRTVLHIGFFEQALDLDTSIMFAPNHMLTGIDIKTLNSNTITTLEQDEMDTYEGSNTSYLPIDSTWHHSLGSEYPEPIYALYRDHYKIRSIRGLADHVHETVPRILNPSGTTQ